MGAVLVLAACGVSWYWNRGTVGRDWATLTEKREKVLYTRYLTSFRAFLSRQIPSLNSVTFEFPLGMFADDTMHVMGSVFGREADNGRIYAIFFYRGMNEEPSSAEIDMELSPTMQQVVLHPELEALLKAAKTGPATATLGGQPCLCSLTPSGSANLKLRFAYPANWMESYPEYDRGFSDEMFFGIGRKAIRYLRKNALLAGQLIRIEVQPPIVNPPGSNVSEGVGLVQGVIIPPKGTPALLEMDLSSSTGWPHKSTLHIRVRGLQGMGSIPEEVKKLFRPDFLQTIAPDGAVQGAPQEIDFDLPLGDLD